MNKLLVMAALGSAVAAFPVAAADRDQRWAGTYEVRLPDGTIRISTLADDGSFSDRQNGEVVDTGYWSTVEGKVCFDHRGPDGSVARSRCYTPGQPAADGTFTATPDAGPAVTLRKLG